MNNITWLHLSDLHFRAEDAFNRKVVLDALWRDIEDQMREGLKPDFIAFTGDVAWRGQEQEYQLAEEHFFKPLLATTGLTPKELFIVPGNHDVDRNIAAMLSANVIAQLQTRDAVNDFLASEWRRKIVFMSTGAYAAFIRRIFAGYWEPDDPAYWYTRTFQKNGKTVALLGLNSAWLSGHFKEADQVNDYGRLLVGELQVAQAVDAAKSADIKIALLHHPFEWCQESDRSDVESRLREACHFILRGHQHRAGFIREVTFDGECVVIPAGAAYDRREYPNGYAFIQLDLRTSWCRIHLRRYSDSLRRWVKNIEATGEAQDGRWDFTLPKAPGVASTPQASISTTSVTSARTFCDGKIGTGVFNPGCSVAKKEVQQNILQFLKSNSVAMVLIGAAGVGKTFLICQMAYRSLSDETQLVLAYDSSDLPNLLRQLPPVPSDTLGEALGRIIARDLGYSDFSALERKLNYLAHFLGSQDAYLLVCFDGIDAFRLDNRPPDHLMVAINALVERFAGEQSELCRIKFIITCLDSMWDLLVDERQLAVRHYYYSQAGHLTWPAQEFTEEEFKEAYQKYTNKPADGKAFQETKGISQKHPYLLRIAAEFIAIGEAVTKEKVFNDFYQKRVRRGSKTEQIRKERFLAGLIKAGYTDDRGIPALDVNIDDPAYETLSLDGIITPELTRNPLTRISEYVLKLRPRGLAEYLRKRFGASNGSQPNQAEGTA